MKKSKRLTKTASVTIPKDIRTEVGFVPGMAVDIETKGNAIIIKPHTLTCRFCGAVKDVTDVYGVGICIGCAENVMKKVKNGV